MDTSLKSNFFGKHTFTYKKVNKYSTKNKTFATKPIRDTRVSLSPFWSINEYVSNYWDINSALVFVLMIVDRIKYNSDSFNENSLIVNAKKYCWVKKVWNKRVQLIKLLFNFSRNNMRFFYLILNEFLFPKEFILVWFKPMVKFSNLKKTFSFCSFCNNFSTSFTSFMSKKLITFNSNFIFYVKY